MSFEEIAPLHASQKKVAPDKVVLSTRKFGRKGEIGIELQFGSKSYKMLGWRSDQRVKVSWGRREDFGKVKIEPIGDDTLGWELRPNKQKTIFKVVITNLPEGFDRRVTFHRAACDFNALAAGNVSARYALLEVPSTFFTKEARERETPKGAVPGIRPAR